MSNASPVYRIIRILTGCVSAETAYVQADYPYGRQLRCQRRNWLEYKRGKGFRVVTQTNDAKYADKHPGAPLVWNKPHASTYTDFALLCLTDEHTDDKGKPTHVTWIGGSVNSSADAIESIMAAYWTEMDETQQSIVKQVHALTTKYGSKPTGALLTVVDATTGEKLSEEPVSGAWQGFAGAWPVANGSGYSPRLDDLGERYPSGVFKLPRLGRLARVEWVKAEQAAA